MKKYKETIKPVEMEKEYLLRNGLCRLTEQKVREIIREEIIKWHRENTTQEK